VFLLVIASIAFAQDTGRISGVVKDAKDGKPLAFANVVIVGTGLGSFTKPSGMFTLEGIPAGTYTLKVMMMGYAQQTRENVVVTAGLTTEVDFDISVTVVMEVEEIRVTAQKKMVDVNATQTKRTVDTQEVQTRAINTVEEAIAVQAGVVLEQGQIHIRGGRSGEVKFFVDGMQVSDPFVGQGQMNVSFASLSEFEVLSGGFDAEFGNVQSGIVNLKTREGGTRYSGVVKYMTDDYGSPDKTYFNEDDLMVGFGGPVRGTSMRFYVSGELNFSDTYLQTLEPRQQKEILGIKFRERQRNNYSAQGKLTYLFSPTRKLSFEVLASGGKGDFYNHSMSRVGYWSESREHWWFEPIDSTYTLYIGPAHTPDLTNSHNQYKFVWNHTLSPTSFYTARVATFRTLSTQQVLDKEPYQYMTPAAVNRLDPENRYFMVTGDYPVYQRYETRMSTAKADMTIQKGLTHQVKFGGELNHYRLEMMDITFPSFDQPLGVFTDIYKFNCWGVSAFLQDRIRFEGMNVRAGLRLDVFDPGREAVEAYNSFLEQTQNRSDESGFFSRSEWQISPRLGVSYPISERDALYFNYGRFYQVPRLEVLFQFLGQTETGLLPFGNPLMDAETTISYEIGIQHQFSNTVMGDIAMFYKDIFGLIGTRAGDLVDDSEFHLLPGPGLELERAPGRQRGGLRSRPRAHYRAAARLGQKPRFEHLPVHKRARSLGRQRGLELLDGPSVHSHFPEGEGSQGGTHKLREAACPEHGQREGRQEVQDSGPGDIAVPRGQERAEYEEYRNADPRLFPGRERQLHVILYG
jgi:outer membrane receptor protein involved in Fe transport